MGSIPAPPRQRTPDHRKRHPDRSRRLRAASQLKLSLPFGRRLAWAALGVFTLLVLAAGSWTVTCGFDGCPSAAQIVAFRPSEGGRVLDRAGATTGRVDSVGATKVRPGGVP